MNPDPKAPIALGAAMLTQVAGAAPGAVRGL